MKPTKSWLIVKSAEKHDEAHKLFRDSPINITIEGKRHLGAAIGSPQFKEEYINEKVNKWTSNIEALAEIAKSEPHAAYAAYLHGEQHKYNYFKRTLLNIDSNLKPLDDAITNLFIPSLFGGVISENERNVISLPIREGGLGVRKVGENSDLCFKTSTKITQPLIDEIIKQSDNVPSPDEVKTARVEALQIVKTHETEWIETTKLTQTPHTQRTLQQLSEPGASSWLGVLPLKSQGFNLTKSEFQDALSLRYNREIKNLPSECPSCGKPFNVTHAMDCHLGGFINARHDNLRDAEY